MESAAPVELQPRLNSGTLGGAPDRSAANGIEVALTVPWAFVPVTVGQEPNARPLGLDPKSSAFNVTFTGTGSREPKPIEPAYAFEQATETRVAPLRFRGGAGRGGAVSVGPC